MLHQMNILFWQLQLFQLPRSQLQLQAEPI